MMEKLAVNHKQWINYALKVCGNIDYANDLVKDMYLKICGIIPIMEKWWKKRRNSILITAMMMERLSGHFQQAGIIWNGTER